MKKLASEKGLVKVTLIVGIIALLLFGINSGFAMVQGVTSNSESGIIIGGTNTSASGVATSSHTLATDGKGAVTLSPDEVQITIGELTQAATAQAASDANAKVIGTVLDRLSVLGITNSSISTVSYSIGPLYDYKSNPPSIYAFQAQHSLQVTLLATNVNELGAKVGQVIDAAVGAGANQVSQVAFTPSDQTMKRASNQALQLAIQDAASKAKLMVAALNVSIIAVGSISSSSSAPPIQYYAATDIAGSGKTVILPGDYTVTASVQVIYEIQ